MVDRRPFPHAHGEVVQIASHGVCGTHTLPGMAETVECLEFSGGVCGLINGFVSARRLVFRYFRVMLNDGHRAVFFSRHAEDMQARVARLSNVSPRRLCLSKHQKTGPQVCST